VRSKLVIGIGAALFALALIGVLARNEALTVYPVGLLVACIPAAALILIPRQATLIAWLTALLSVLWAVAVVGLASGGGESFGLIVLGAVGAAFFVLATLAQAIALVVRLVARDGAWRGQALALVLQAAMVGLVLAAAITNFAFEARFALARPQFDSAAQGVLSGHPMAIPTRLGSFEVSGVETSTNDVTFTLGDDFTRIVFSPQGAPGTEDDGFERLNGNWWLEQHND
jgi:hypothetical protein